MLELCRTDERDKSRGCLHTMRCKEEEDKVNVSKLNEVKQVQDDILCVASSDTGMCLTIFCCHNGGLK